MQPCKLLPRVLGAPRDVPPVQSLRHAQGALLHVTMDERIVLYAERRYKIARHSLDGTHYSGSESTKSMK